MTYFPLTAVRRHTTSTVIAAVDGICLQTSESIGCAEELGLPAVVALNKIDLLPDEEAAQVTSSLTFEACVLCCHVPPSERLEYRTVVQVVSLVLCC